VTVTETNGGSASQIFAVTVGAAPSQAPEILTQPQAELVLASGTSHTVAFTVTASSASAMTYQWRRNGVALDGQQSPTCVLQNAADAQAGDYTCLVRNSVGSVVSQAAKLSFAPTAAPDQSRLTNLSVRTVAGTGARTLIVGFALGGAGRSGTAPLLVRGVGPSLAQFGLTGILPDPIATMGGGTPPSQVTNDNWATAGAAAVAERAAQVGAFALAPASLDAALAVSPAAASYTVQITDRENRTGIALAEIYEAVTRSAYTPTTPRLVNVSARTEVGTGSDILIAGFNISGTTAKTVLIRAIGPTLAQFGVNDTLADPKLQLFAGSKQLAGNDNWGGDAVLTTTGTAVGAFALPNSTSGDSVLLATLPPGSYTAQVSGANDGTGVALVEIYEVP
jgi:hypothetical protein